LALGSNLAQLFFPYQPTFPGWETLPFYQLPQALTSTANFDGIHYLNIMDHSYQAAALIQAFFPLYPLIGGWLDDLFFHNSLLAAQIVSQAAALIAFFVFYHYTRRFFSSTTAVWAVLALAFFPSSFFLINVYSESLFLGLLLLCFWLYRCRSWTWLSLALIALTATRITGIILVVVLLISYLLERMPFFNATAPPLRTQFRQPHFYWPILSIALGSLGLIAYMTYLAIFFGQPLLFWQVQSEFGSGRQQSLVVWPQVIWRYTRSFIALAGDQQLFNNWKSYAYWQELILAVGATLVLFGQFVCLNFWRPLTSHLTTLFNSTRFAASRTNLATLLRRSLDYLNNSLHLNKIPLEISLFSLGACLMPPLTGNFSSMPRYLLLCPALFLGFALLKSRLLKIILLLGSAGLLYLNLMLFTQGYWVA
jgi:hypothetical protein